MELLDSGEYQRYTPTKKAHATLFEKKCFPLYLEHLALLIKRLGWVVTKIHQHLTFEQKRFKKNFIIRNQNARQKAKNNVEKDFYKLLNNSNLVMIVVIILITVLLFLFLMNFKMFLT